MRNLPNLPADDDAAVPDECAADACGGCEGVPDRRRFLRDAMVLAGAALAALGASSSAAAALPVRLLRATVVRGETRRYPLPAADGVEIDHDAEVMLARWQGHVYAFALACPHQHVALRWLPADTRFQCPKHKSKYRPDGTFIEGRATRGLDRYGITRDGAAVVVDLDALHQQDDDPAGWNAAAISLDA